MLNLSTNLLTKEYLVRFGPEADPAIHSLDDMIVYVDIGRIPERWRDEVIAHEKAEMEAEVEFGLTSDAERNERLDLVLVAHTRAIAIEYQVAARKGELDAYHDWIRQVYAEAIEKVSGDSDKKNFYARLLAEREGMVSQIQKEL